MDHRPQTFDEIVGQRHIKPILRKMVENPDKLPPAMLFSGTRGTGKTTTARVLAAALNCQRTDDGPRPCTQCVSCKAVRSGGCLDVLEIDAASNGLVADIRKIKEVVLYSHGGAWRLVMLDEAHSMSKESFNALLKVLEEPPPNCIFILLTTEPNKILDTVVSRSMSFDFRRITVTDIVDRLRHIASVEQIDVPDDLLTEIAVRSQGGMRDAIMVLDQLRTVDIKDVASFRDLFGFRNVSVELLAAAVDGDHARGSQVVAEHFYRVGDATSLVTDLVSLVRDLLILRAGGVPVCASSEELEERRNLSSRVNTEKLVAVIKVLWDLRNRVRAIDNDQRAAMEMAFVLVADAVSDATKVVTAPVAAQKMTLSQMAALTNGH